MVPSLSYKNETVPLVVDPTNTAETRKRALNLLTSVLTDIGEILRSKLVPTEKNIQHFVDCLSLASNKKITVQLTPPAVFFSCSPVQEVLFRIKRFPELIDILKSVIQQRLNEALNEFDRWCRDFSFDAPLLIPEFFPGVNGGVFCLLQWSKPETLHQYPHLMLEKFYVSFSEAFSSKDDIVNLEEEDLVLLTKESFKSQRLELLQRLHEVREVSNALVPIATEPASHVPFGSGGPVSYPYMAKTANQQNRRKLRVKRP
jgi:hypothetical protein